MPFGDPHSQEARNTMLIARPDADNPRTDVAALLAAIDQRAERTGASPEELLDWIEAAREGSLAYLLSPPLAEHIAFCYITTEKAQ